jgi:hypothetical protein
MSHTHPTAHSSSPNFQKIFNAAVKSYEKRTKSKLLDHPLAIQLQACDSPSDVLLVLQQVQELNQSRASDEGLSRWLNPTVNVLFALSGVFGEGVGLVCFNTWDRLESTCSWSFPGIFPCEGHLYWSRRPPFGVYPHLIYLL